MLTKRVLAVILLLLLAFPAWGGPSVVGSVASSQSATVRGTRLAPGSTILSGDAIEVGAQGSAWIALLGGAEVQLGEKSQARLTKTTEKIQLTIDRGLASFRTVEKSEFEALLADATIRSANGRPALGIISVRSPQLAVIAAKRGALLISTAHDLKSLTLEEGQGVDVTLIPGATTTSSQSTAILGGAVAASGALLGETVLNPDQGGGCSGSSPPTSPHGTGQGRGHCP